MLRSIFSKMSFSNKNILVMNFLSKTLSESLNFNENTDFEQFSK